MTIIAYALTDARALDGAIFIIYLLLLNQKGAPRRERLVVLWTSALALEKNLIL
jgi:hypothetical protein